MDRARAGSNLGETECILRRSFSVSTTLPSLRCERARVSEERDEECSRAQNRRRCAFTRRARMEAPPAPNRSRTLPSCQIVRVRSTSELFYGHITEWLLLYGKIEIWVELGWLMLVEQWKQSIQLGILVDCLLILFRFLLIKRIYHISYIKSPNFTPNIHVCTTASFLMKA